MSRRVRVYCVGSVKRLGGEDDGCRWAGYRVLPNPTKAPCPHCGNYVARPGFGREHPARLAVATSEPRPSSS